MEDVIREYQRWKQQGEDLRDKAKNSMEARFRDLLNEAVQIAGEYRADFGSPLKPPPAVTAFRYKASGKKAAKKAKPGALPAKGAPPAKAAPAPAPKVEAKPDPRVVALEKKLAAAKKKLEAAKASGTSTKNLEDRVYEIEDDLRLATKPV